MNEYRVFHDANDCFMLQIQLPDTHLGSFLALLEFLYTDHAPICDVKGNGLLLIADKYGISKLVNYCEIFIINQLDKLTESSRNNAVEDIIDALLMAQVKYNIVFKLFNYQGVIPSNSSKYNQTIKTFYI